MKCRSSVHLYLAALLTMLFCQPAFPASAITTLPASGTWAGGTLENDIEVAVTSGPTVTGTIVIPSGKTLTLSIASSVTADHVTLSVPADFSGNCIFKVESGGTLKISGASYGKYFGIRGGTGNLVAVDKNGVKLTERSEVAMAELRNDAAYTYPDLKDGAICSSGTLVLENVRIYDVQSSSNGAIYIPQDSYKKHGTTSLKGCWLHRIKSARGAALMVEAQVTLNTDGSVALGTENTAASCAVTMDNVYIFQCHVTGDDAGQSGCIRTYGNCVSNINLKDVWICQNKSDGDGCAVYWNGHGRPDTKMTFDGCKIYNNHSAEDGGALHLEGAFEFINNLTEIYKNSAGHEGGAIFIKLYASNTNQVRTDLKMDFNQFVSIHDNKSVSNGGAVAISFSETSLPEESTIAVSLNGAQISKNVASGSGACGGGVYLWTNLETSKNIGLSLNVSGNTRISGNEATGNGGGIYCKRSTDDSQVVSVVFDSGTISDNIGNNGGGVYIERMDAECTEAATGLEFNGNTARYNGGALFVNMGSLIMRESTITGNRSFGQDNFGYGGGVYVKGGGNFTIYDGTISSNTAKVRGGGVGVNNGTVTIDGGTISSNKAGIASDKSEIAGGIGGGIHVTGGGNITIADGTISDNYATQDGGGVYCEGGNITMSDGEFSRNKALSYGGGVYVVSGGFKMSGGSFLSNKCNGRGGGLYSYGGKIEIVGGVFQSNWAALQEADLVTEGKNGGAICHRAATVESGDNYSMILKGGVFKDNKADRGGAICIYYANVLFDRLNGTEVDMSENWADNTGAAIAIYDGGSMTVNGGKFLKNVSDNTAGAIHINTSGGSVTMNDGLFDGNSATDFGGVVNMTAGTLTINGGTYTNNKCINSESGKGSGGAIYVRYPATCNIVGGTFSANTASNFGGAMYLPGCQCYVSGGTIIGNSASVAGGGVALSPYEENSSTYYGQMTMRGGEIRENTAPRGGGVYGDATAITMSEGIVAGNIAVNGGGLFITGGASMTFADGFISNNRALINLTADGADTMSKTTAYAPSDNLYGVGGGVFLGAGTSGKVTTLTFGASGEEGNFGLYNNIAETAADDIYAYGQYTSITLPDISKMSLKGYNSKTSELYWVEDFMTGDTAYHDYGTNINTSGSYSPIRYRQAITAQKTVYKVLTTDPITKYVALSLGHEIIFITLQKTGLRAGESAIFRIFRVENDERTIYSEVLLVGVEGLSTVSKRVALYSGTWQVTEVPWAWSYDSEPVSYIRPIVGETEESDKIFVFTGVKKAAPPLHAEDIVVNDFGKGSAVTGSKVNTGTISDLDQTQDYQLK